MQSVNLEHEATLAVHLALLRADDPMAAAEQTVENEIRVRLKDVPNDDPRQVRGVKEICHGAVLGLFKEHIRLSLGAVAVLRGALRAAPELGQDEQTMLAYALAGVADIAQSVSAELLSSVQEEIGRAFPGSAEVFGRLVQRTSAKRNHVLAAHRRHET